MAAPYLNNQYINIHLANQNLGMPRVEVKLTQESKFARSFTQSYISYIYIYCSHPSIHPSIHPFPNSTKKHHLLWCWENVHTGVGTLTPTKKNTDESTRPALSIASPNSSPDRSNHQLMIDISESEAWNFQHKKRCFFGGIYPYVYIYIYIHMCI